MALPGLNPGLRAALESEAARFDELQQSMMDPDVASAPSRLAQAARQAGALRKRVERFREYQRLEVASQEAEQVRDSETDEDLIELAGEELEQLVPALEELSDSLTRDVLSRHRYSDRNVIVEIRAGTGGDEATLFAAELMRMYQRVAERRGFKLEELSGQPSDVGGVKEVTLSIEGASVFDTFRFESGGHRVQRVPATESQGRIHTSAATVAVLAEPEELEVSIKEADLRIDTYRAGGPGGQKVNKTSSAIRITHLPTGVVVTCQDESSQHKNKAKAMRTLRSRLFEVQEAQAREERDSSRRSQIGTGDRSEKIRTYNFPQDRLTDHRIKKSFFNLASLMDGELEDVLESLREDEANRRLAELQDAQND